jgi:hypothetical protein
MYYILMINHRNKVSTIELFYAGHKVELWKYNENISFNCQPQTLLIMSHYVSLCLIMSHYVSLCLIMSHYVSLLIIPYSLFTYLFLLFTLLSSIIIQVDDLMRTLQHRDAALAAVKRLETQCDEAGFEHIAIYEVEHSRDTVE